MPIPQIVYEVVNAFNNTRVRTAGQIQSALESRVSIAYIEGTLLPNLVDAGLLTVKPNEDKSKSIYKLAGLANADTKKLVNIK